MPREGTGKVAADAAVSTDFPVVGLGASAGGLEAFEQFFRLMPPDSGMAFVLVSHLDPEHESLLTEILQRSTAMPAAQATDGLKVEPDHVYVIPPNRDMTFEGGALHLEVPERPRGQRMPIDLFLRSLANDRGDRAVGVVLSGTGSDGTLGLRAVLGAGGVSFVQDPVTAKYDGMPLSAIRSGVATYVLSAEAIPERLAAHVRAAYTLGSRPAVASPPPSGLGAILALLRARTGHDFSLYKESTIRRRVERRMAIHGLDEMSVYERYLGENRQEAQVLFKEMLINVTSFFRDAEAFEAIKRDALRLIFESQPGLVRLRGWVPGCATGEEAYSIAMLIREFLDESRLECRVQIYATDLDEDAIAVARSGDYPANIVSDVSEKRLRQFFVKGESGYRVKREIRDMIVFAVQNVIKDPPFTRLDLLSCRNLLIYLEPKLQERLIPGFHYALKPGGMLILSSSESLGAHSDLFAAVSRKWKIFRAKPLADAARPGMAARLFWSGGEAGPKAEATTPRSRESGLADLAGRLLLQTFAPASVITDESGNILYVHGDTGRYLRPAPGQASLNVIAMAREGLQRELRTALHTATAAAGTEPVVVREVPVPGDGGPQPVTVTVRRVQEGAAAMLLASFQDSPAASRKKPLRRGPKAPRAEAGQIEELERELLSTKENLQATIEEFQSSNEEIMSSNEELQSMNEELQSTNEELETSKEELQSVNEELVTVNSELQAKIEHISGIESDLKNLFDCTNIGTIFLDAKLSIKRFTRSAAAIFRLVATDVGRPLSDIKSNLGGEVDLVEEARNVLETLAQREATVLTSGGESYLARVLPYRTLDNVIDGVVLTFTNITEIRRAEELLKGQLPDPAERAG